MNLVLPEDVMMADLVSETDAAIYSETGKCHLLMDSENLLRGMAENNYLIHGSAVNSNDFPWLTGDLYAGMNGEISDLNPITVNTIISGTTLKVRVKNAATGNYTTGGTQCFQLR